MKKITWGVVLALALSLLLMGCSSGKEKLAVSDAEYADYVGTWFQGEDPWGGKLTVTIKSIVKGKMDWSLTDAFDNATYYQEVNGTDVKDGAASFDVQGSDAENKKATFHYQGTMELKDGTVVMTFDQGTEKPESSESASSAEGVQEAADANRSNRVTLERPKESELNTYTVQSGDSIHSIAKKYGISTKDLAIMNQTVIIDTAKKKGYEFDDVIEYANYLFPGEVLVVPATNQK